MGELTGLAWTNFLLGVVLSHQPFGLVNGFNLLLKGNIGLRRLLSAGHASRVAVPRDLATDRAEQVHTDMLKKILQH